MIILKNGQYIYEDDAPQVDEPAEENKAGDAITEFFEGLASSETNSIAKIRNLAQTFLDNTNDQ